LTGGLSVATIFVRFDFGSGKDATNLRNHGLSLAAAAELSWDAALVWIDDRADYGEVRMVALAPLGDILYFGPTEKDRSIAAQLVSAAESR
jgi:uncharacterized DUF497 family protein